MPDYDTNTFSVGHANNQVMSIINVYNQKVRAFRSILFHILRDPVESFGESFSSNCATCLVQSTRQYKSRNKIDEQHTCICQGWVVMACNASASEISVAVSALLISCLFANTNTHAVRKSSLSRI